MADDFIDVDDLTDYIGIDVSGDPGALIAVSAACDICRDTADQTFNAGTTTVTLDGTGTDMLLLPQLPVVSAGTVNVAGTAVVEDTDYVVDANRGMLVRTDAVWPRGRQNVEITYEHGFTTDDLPRSVRMVALAIAQRLVVQGNTLFETVGDVSVRYGTNATDLTNGERAILYKYRNGRRAD